MRIFIDTDCGVDDALAIAVLAGFSCVELAGVTSTSGNTHASQAAGNADRVLHALGNYMPVIPGPEPKPSFRPRAVHGEDGLGGLGGAPLQIPHPTAAAEAVQRFCSTARSDDVLLCLGPLTNVAAAAPPTAPRIVAVGGAGIEGEHDPGKDPNSKVDIAASMWVANNLHVDWVTINSGEDVWLSEEEFPSATAKSRLLRAIHDSYGWHCAERAGRSLWSPSAYDAMAALVAVQELKVSWTDVTPIFLSETMWGRPGGEHRMLEASAGADVNECVRAAVRDALS